MQIKALFITIGLIVFLTLIGTVLIYIVFGIASGRASLCISGIVSAAVVGFGCGMNVGPRFMPEITLIASILSLPLIPLFYALKNDHADMISGLAPSSIGLAIFLGFNIAQITRSNRVPSCE